MIRQIATLSVVNARVSSQLIRPLLSRCYSFRNKSWDDELEDELSSYEPQKSSYSNNRFSENFESDGRDFQSDRSDFQSDRRDFQSDRRDFRGDRRNFQSDRRDFESDRRDFRGDRRGFQTNRNEYMYERSNFYEGRRNKFDVPGENLSNIKWDNIELQPFKKNFYTPSPELVNKPMEEVEEFRKSHNMTIIGNDAPNPIQSFTDFEFPSNIMDIIEEKGFTAPTPIQSQCWPIALSGQDLIGIGQTGSGKTLGFVLPGMIHINHQDPIEQDDGPIGLVIAPTRELVQQIHEVTDMVFRRSGSKAVCLFGGASKGNQIRNLYSKPSIIIATPGRLLDILEMGVTNMKRCTYLVLDEADRMLDMGFEPQIRKILGQTRPDRQTLMWSATWPKEVQELAGQFLTDPIQVNVGSVDLVANPDVEQEVIVCDSFEKLNRVIAKVKDEIQILGSKVLIFNQTKSQVDFLTRKLNNMGIQARGIHGDYSQSSRNNTLHGFRIGRFPVLVATDVASRGLDVDDISLVINYDFPYNIEDYIHRIGRTARAGKAGRSFSILTDTVSSQTVKELIRVMKEANQDVPTELYALMSQTGSPTGKNFKRKFHGGYGSRRY